MRNYLIANAPDKTGFIDLHILRRERGMCNNMIFMQPTALKEKVSSASKNRRDICPAKRQHQTDYFLSHRTGFATVRSMSVELIRQQSQRAEHLY
nr:hypothetical protein [Neisseria yangbaofengii]